MRIDVRLKDPSLSQDVKDHAIRRLQFALGRFGERIREVRVRLSDVNGTRGGVDKECRIDVRGERSLSVLVDDVDSDIRVAINRAADRAGRSIARALERLRRGWM